MAVVPGGLDLQPGQSAFDQVNNAASGRLAPAGGAADRHRLAGHDLADRMADIGGIGVHEPGHDLLVGAHVGRHDVGMRPDERDHLLHIAAGHRLQLTLRQLGRVAGDAALGAAIGQAGQRAFPAHPDRQRPDLADIDIGGEADTALGRPKRQVMLYSIALEHGGRPVIHMDRDRHADRALRVQKAVAFIERDAQMIGDGTELFLRHGEDRAGINCHGNPLKTGRAQEGPNWAARCFPNDQCSVLGSRRLAQSRNGWGSALA